jgi:dynein heavy chain
VINWAENDNPVGEKMNSPYDDKLTIFQKLLLIKLIKEDRTLTGVIEYVKRTLGEDFMSNEAPALEQVCKDTDH